MKVVILAAAIGPTSGGAGQYSRQLLPALLPLLKAEGFQTTVLLRRDANLEIPSGLARVIRSPRAGSGALSRVLMEETWPGYVTWGTDLFFTMDSRFPLGPVWSKRRVAVVHDIQILRHLAAPNEYPIDAPTATLKYFSWGMRKALRTADTLITDAQFTADEVVRFAGVRRERLCVIPCGVDHQRFHTITDGARREEVRSRYQLPPRFYLFVGQPTQQKNLRLIVDAYAAGRLSDDLRLPVVVTCKLARSALFQDTLARIEQAGLTSLFPFTGYVREEDLPVLYAEAHALLYPSRYEGFGLPPLEAMACGTPVVCSNTTSLPEVVGDAALLIDPEQPASLIAALGKVNEGPIREELVRKGPARAKAFTWERTASEVVRQVIAREGSARLV